MEEEYNKSVISNYRNVSVTEGPLWLQFWSNLFGYLSLRVSQIFRISVVAFILSVESVVEFKGFVVRKMYWGRTSFYRSTFQILVIFLTVGALLASINSRTNIFAQEKQGVIASTGAIGNNDIFLQVGTTDSIIETAATDVGFSIEKYTVQAGDTLSAIANRYGVSEDTVRWANDIPSGRETLHVGQVLDIPPMDGVLYTVEKGDSLDSVLKKAKGANKFDLIELNNLEPPDFGLRVGQKLFIPDAEYNPPVVAKRTHSTNYVNLTNTAVNVAPGTFVNPMMYCPGYTFVRGWRYSHTGVDLAHSPGCWINSIGSGTIMKAGWCGSTMGFCTVIRHDNGYSSLYLHGQGQFAVKGGQRVGAGQKIMTLGNTGYSFGSHLHLSISAPGVDVVNNYHGRINPAGIVPY